MGCISTNATSTRATLLANAPTASRHVLVSTPDRHLVFFGTETTVGINNYKMICLLDFLTQESIDQTDSYTVKAENTQVHKDLLMVLKLWELLKVEMQFMYGPILHCF